LTFSHLNFPDLGKEHRLYIGIFGKAVKRPNVQIKNKIRPLKKLANRRD
jgi:hypothetical protein